VTLWERPEDAAALEDSDRYRETVAAIMATGFVRRAEEALAVPVVSWRGARERCFAWKRALSNWRSLFARWDTPVSAS
jgi:hypothetical protein